MTLSDLAALVCQESGLTLDALQGRGKPIRLANARSCLAILSLRFGPPRCGSAVDRLLHKGDGVCRRLRADHGRRLECVPSYRAGDDPLLDGSAPTKITWQTWRVRVARPDFRASKIHFPKSPWRKP